jgi:hypothetical protein
VISSIPELDGDDEKAVVAIEKVTHLEWAAELPKLQLHMHATRSAKKGRVSLTP